MNTSTHELYLNRVERLMEKLRAACLGQDTRLLAALPTYLLTAPSEQKAAHLARQIVFVLAAASDEEAPESYQQSYEWLYETILYLLRECNKSDQTFMEMTRLMKLPFDVRKIIFSKKTECESGCNALCKDEKMPELLEHTEVAILCLLESLKLNERMKQTYKKLESLLSEG